MGIKIGSFNRNVILNYFFKVLTILLGIVSVNVNLGYLGSTFYGLWATLSSIISWMHSGDFGIGNGLRNELAKAYSKEDYELQKKLVFTALSTMSRIAVCIFGILILVGEAMFATGFLDALVRIPFYITSVFFCINLVIGISQSMAYALRRSWYVACVNFMSIFLSICLVSCIKKLMDEPNLVLFAFINGIYSLLPNLILLIMMKKRQIDFGAIHLTSDEKKGIREKIWGMGIQFFGIQICAVVLYSTDNAIINYLFGSEQVTKYSIISKVYDTGNSLFSILLVEMWSAVTFHVARDDYGWVLSKIRLLLKAWIMYSCGVIIVSLAFNWIVGIWLGSNAMFFEASLIFVFGVYGIVASFSNIFANVVNGMGVVRLQFVLAALEAVANIPLSVFFARYCGMGIMGVKLATLLCVIAGAIAIPIQVMGILRRKIPRSR